MVGGIRGRIRFGVGIGDGRVAVLCACLKKMATSAPTTAAPTTASPTTATPSGTPTFQPTHGETTSQIELGLGIGLPLAVLALVLAYFGYRYYKYKHGGSYGTGVLGGG